MQRYEGTQSQLNTHPHATNVASVKASPHTHCTQRAPALGCAAALPSAAGGGTCFSRAASPQHTGNSLSALCVVADGPHVPPHAALPAADAPGPLVQLAAGGTDAVASARGVAVLGAHVAPRGAAAVAVVAAVAALAAGRHAPQPSERLLRCRCVVARHAIDAWLCDVSIGCW